MKTPRGLSLQPQRAPLPRKELAVVKTSAGPVQTAPFQPATDIGDNPQTMQIVKWEGRYDRSGKLQVYNLPASDKGGRYEVAGINDKYHPEMAAELAKLVRSGQADVAEKKAAQYIDNYTKDVATWTSNKGVEFFLRDTAFNRGVGGATKVVQMALNEMGHSLKVDGGMGPKTRAALRDAEANPKEFIAKLRQARQNYEIKTNGKRSDFWAGLLNRWNGAEKVALSKA